MTSKLVPGQRLLLLVLVLSVAVGCAANQPPRQTPAPAATLAAAPAASPTAPSAEPETDLTFDTSTPEERELTEQVRREGVQPPDGVWLRDEEGAEYFLTELPRHEGHYLWEDDGRSIRIREGVFRVDSYDENVFRLRIYRTESIEQMMARMAAEEAAAGSVSRAAVLNEFDTPESSRLRFESFDKGLPGSGQWRNGFVLADMNGDGHLDIVHGPARKGRPEPAIWLGDGQGHWRRWAAARFEPAPYDYGDVAVADFNGDGHLDLALGIHLRGLIVLVGDGAGSFRRWDEGLPLRMSSAEVTEFSSRAIAVTDWNGDGRPDLVALGEGGSLALSPDASGRRGVSAGGRGLRVYLNGGDGSWQPVAIDDGAGFGSGLALADFDGDGRPDIFTGTSRRGSRHLLHLQRDDGTVAPVTPGDTLRRQATVAAVANGDLGGGSGRDVAVAFARVESGHRRTGVDLLLQDTEGSWSSRPLWNALDTPPLRALGAGDLDGDGRLDLVAAGDEGQILVFLQGEDGTWTREVSPGLTGHEKCAAFAVAIADLGPGEGALLVASFAGEPGVRGGGPVVTLSACPSSGAIKAWRVKAK